MDESQFVALLSEHQRIIHKVCHLYRDTREDREDLFQEITFQLWKSYPSFKGNAKPGTWIYRIALNTAIATFRKKKPPITFTDALPDIPEEQSSEELISKHDRLFDALRKLDDGDKAMIMLYLDAHSYQEIGEIVGISENYVSVKISRIKNKLQQLLNT